MKLLILILLTSCSWFRSSDDDWGSDLIEDRRVSEQDFVAHYETIGKGFIKNSDIKVVRLSRYLENYLKKISQKVIDSNSSFFKDRNVDLKFYLVSEKKPLHFSLPSGEIFFSTGLVKKYIEHESNLISVLTFELIKIDRKIYPRKFTIPKGYVSLPYFLSLLRVPLDDKIEVHKWSYYLLKRSGFDENGYLIWVQTQNRNYLDFSLHLGDHSSIFKEEAELKNFVVENYGQNFDLSIEFNSSRMFYEFIAVLR